MLCDDDEAAAADATRAFQDGLKTLISAVSSSVTAASALEKSADDLFAALARERAEIEEERCQLESLRAEVGDLPVSCLPGSRSVEDKLGLIHSTVRMQRTPMQGYMPEGSLINPGCLPGRSIHGTPVSSTVVLSTQWQTLPSLDAPSGTFSTMQALQYAEGIPMAAPVGYAPPGGSSQTKADGVGGSPPSGVSGHAETMFLTTAEPSQSLSQSLDQHSGLLSDLGPGSDRKPDAPIDRQFAGFPGEVGPLPPFTRTLAPSVAEHFLIHTPGSNNFPHDISSVSSTRAGWGGWNFPAVTPLAGVPGGRREPSPDEWQPRHSDRSHLEKSHLEKSPMRFSLPLGRRSYAVLPPAAENDERPGHDMCGKAVDVPPGWEVLRTDADHFQDIMGALCQRGWGTLRLCARDARDPQGGFASFATTLRRFQVPGTREASKGFDVPGLEEHVLQAVPGSAGRRFKFSDKLVSGRLVVVQADGRRMS